jgi:hypothetical protein
MAIGWLPLVVYVWLCGRVIDVCAACQTRTPRRTKHYLRREHAAAAARLQNQE